MSKSKKYEIIQNNKILNDITLNSIIFDYDCVNSYLSNSLNAISFFASCSIIRNEMLCQRCTDHRRMCIRKSTKHIDGYMWVCERACGYSCTVKEFSKVHKFRLSLKKIFLIIHAFTKGIKLDQIAHDYKIGRNTVARLCEFVKETIIDHLQRTRTKIGGEDEYGMPKIVEIDESYFFKAKYNRGRNWLGQWYVGGIERGSRKAFVVPVVNRNIETLLGVLRENIHEHSIIITDQWRAYRRAVQGIENTQHRTINHSTHFVDPNDRSLHTQNIEALWSRLKNFLRQKQGSSKRQQYHYMLQHLWEAQLFKHKRIHYLIKLLKF